MAHSLALPSFISDDLREIAARRVRECLGLFLIALAIAAALSLASWSVQDPSFSHATNATVHNLLGRHGAIVADLMMQLIGVAAVALLVPIALYGWRLITHRQIAYGRTRGWLWLAATLLLAAFASCLPVSPRWPLPTGLGGVLGDALLRAPVSWLPASWFAGPLAGMNRLAVIAITGGLGCITFLLACGIGWRGKTMNDLLESEDETYVENDETEEENEDRGLMLGWIYHELFSLKARFLRLLAWRPWRRRDEDLSVVAPTRRKSRAFVENDQGNDLDIDEDEEEDEDDTVPRARTRRAPRINAKRRKTNFELPPLNLLAAAKATDRFIPNQDAIQDNAATLESVLGDFGVRGEIINARPGPVVTLYELEPAPGIKSSRVIGLADDIARSMSALSARVAVVPGRNAIGIELPNTKREKVYLREMLASDDCTQSSAKLPLCLGKTIGGEPVIVDLARMPHLLIAGTTGSGKSVAINTMILSLVYRLTPEDCRIIMIDPKMLELSVYDSIPHLLTPVVTDPKKAIVALKWAVREMEERYKKMSKLGVRNIDGYNARLAEAKSRGEVLTRTVHTGYDRESGEAIYEKEKLDLDPLPFIVVIVDEMADLMMVAGKDIEGAIQRLAQMARAAGIHVILATQRPSVDVITGTIKANFPTRISFQVTSKIDSRTILGEQGAEQLLGQGDMLYMAGGGRISRVHGPFVSDEEVEKVVRHLKSQGAPQYLEAVTADDEEDDQGALFDSTTMGGGEANDLFQQAVQIVTRDRKASTSYIQRRLQIGYNRAASIMERMEDEGIVGAANHAGKREILVGEPAHERY